MKKIILIIVSIALLFWIIGHFTSTNTTDSQEPENKNFTTIIIKKDDFKEWPFTVSQGKLWCDGDKILFSADGVLYGVNGAGATFAKSEGGNELKDIIAIDEKKKKELLEIGLTDKQSDAYMDISPILEKGKSLCK